MKLNKLQSLINYITKSSFMIQLHSLEKNSLKMPAWFNLWKESGIIVSKLKEANNSLLKFHWKHCKQFEVHVHNLSRFWVFTQPLRCN